MVVDVDLLDKIFAAMKRNEVLLLEQTDATGATMKIVIQHGDATTDVVGFQADSSEDDDEPELVGFRPEQKSSKIGLYDNRTLKLKDFGN